MLIRAIVRKVMKPIKDFLKYKQLTNKKQGIQIEEGNIFYNLKGINISNYVYIGPNGYFDAKGGITIQQGVCMGPKVSILTSNHRFDDKNLKAIPYDNVNICKEVIIKENVWIGYNVLILPGVEIGEGAVVGAGSVVTKSVPPHAVVGGNPAKILKFRDKDLYYKLKEEDMIFRKIKSDLMNV